jgi:signal transduction histidine kinase
MERVQNNGRHLLGLINDVLDLSKIEAGQFHLAMDTYAPASIVHSVIAATEPLATAKGLNLVSRIDRDLPPAIGDERRLTQVLLNLVGNAIKFTDQGRVEIRAREELDALVVEVQDTGPGIRPADQQRIFEEFQQVDNTSTRQKGGTGLGLAISRRIVELHGGRLLVQSAPGEGAVFRLELPLAADERAAA